MKVSMRWRCWYGNEVLTLEFPPTWDTVTAAPRGGSTTSDEDLNQAFAHPVGTPRLRDMARGKRTAAIAVDDISRPTPLYRFLPRVLEEVREGGISEDDICLVTALGAHRPMDRSDCIKKYGRDVVERVRIFNHHPFENLVDYGTSRRGTPIHINRYFAEADLKLGLGCVVPHANAGFGGGAKIVLPGISGIATLEANHRPAVVPGEKMTAKLGNCDDNENRADIEEIARTVGLDFVANAVINAEGDIAALFMGDMVQAHRRAVDVGRKVYSTEVPAGMDVGVFNAYPKDTELVQAANALNVYGRPDKGVVREGGTIVIITACSEGVGFHSLHGPGMRIYVNLAEHATYGKILRDRRVIIYSPNLSLADVRQYYPADTRLARSWPEVMELLTAWHGDTARTVVFPCASMQLSTEGSSR